ncbi:inositol monophosphatase family protein [Sulfuriroseicoccus oceanibius]|uniref:Inositol-1-monophosphatase n=1 Tax=Sulfuriroseicoccus oceanibius TaxID=2707525 RepID=A0A6B3L474_9BACT|nr:inositol monophosphatase family protein [Sulfuriroseicoccus oceanibius]QQL45338.1 inositol monophosphatase [Sulfuriroseicoccus oceanibius]
MSEIPTTDLNAFLDVAQSAAREAGELLCKHFGSDLEVDSKLAYDIKLALDRESQELITKRLLAAFPGHALLGEEGVDGDAGSPFQWIVDPIDGTVNFFYGIPHFCVSIALRYQGDTLIGVIYDPNLDEMFVVTKGGMPTCNGKEIRVSERDELSDSIVTVGFSKSKESIDEGFERFKEISHQVRKTRMMGSAALAMAYIACGRLDAYIEEQISTWDIAAGLLLVDAAGGTTHVTPRDDRGEKFSICSSNGKLPLEKYHL